MGNIKSNGILTTTNIGTDELKRVKKLSSTFGLKQVDFINYSVRYFSRTGINPAEEIYSPREEIARLEKRIEEILKFIRVFERDEMKPLLEKLILVERRLASKVDDNPIDEQTRLIITQCIQSIEGLKNEMKNPFDNYRKIIEALSTNQKIFNHGQNKTHKMFIALFDALKNKTTMGSFKDVDIKNFEDASR